MESKQSANLNDVWLCGLLVLIAGIVFTRDIHVGGLRWSDSCSRAMDGVLIHDWVAAGPAAWRDPMEFATRQYAHYPSLSIGRVYPPGFALVESVFFALFGISPISARACTVVFGLLAVVGCYLLSRRLMGTLGAVCATGFVIATPGIVFWTRLAMLEMPALAMIIGSVYATWRYFDRPTWRRFVMATLLILGSVLMKQTAAFIVPVLALFFLHRAWRGRHGGIVDSTPLIPTSHVAASLVLVLGPLIAYFTFCFYSGRSTTHLLDVVTMNRPLSEWFSWESISLYPATLPRQIGWVLLSLAVLGLPLSLCQRRWEWKCVLGWFVVCFLMCVVIQYKETRYFFFDYFPIAVWAGFGASWLIDRVRRTGIRVAMTCVLVGAPVMNGYFTPMRYEPDYAPMVEQYADRMRHRMVLFEGLRDGDFVFAVRRRLGPKQCVIVRGSKVFYSCPAINWFDFQSNVSSRADVAEAIDRFGFELIFVERRNPLKLNEVDLLHAELADRERYELIATHTLRVPRPNQEHRSRIVDVFRPREPNVRQVRTYEIPIPIDGRTIRVDLDELLTPGA